MNKQDNDNFKNNTVKNSQKNNKFFVTTAIDYASGKPHIGHAYEKVCADVIARWNRDIGNEVFFLTGTDEHGQKIVEKAAEINKSAQDFVNIMAPQFKNLLTKLNISNDYFVRTTDDSHKTFVSKMLQKSFDNGDIYKGSYEGLYCVGCEKYVEEEDLLEGNICPDHQKVCESVSEENYFFKLSKYENKLLKFYEESDFLQPKSKALETINRVKEGLRDISISRSKEKLEWGIELPFDSNHVTYVWFDALFNYISALDINNKMDFWPANYHIIGKDIKWFHEVYWPAFLMSVDMEVPKSVFAHGMILDENGHKMSKSLNNTIDPLKFVKKFGVDEFRYYIIAGGSFGEDMNFSEKMFIEKVNNELNNDFGNLVSRVHAMTSKGFSEGISEIGELTEDDKELIKSISIYDEFNSLIQNLEYTKAFNVLWTAIRDTNAYVNKVSPWAEKNEKRLGTIMNVLCSACILFGKYTNCIIPNKTSLLFKQFNVVNNNKFEVEFLSTGHKLGAKENLFERIKLDKPVEKVEAVREGFSKLNLRVGQVCEVSKHPDSDKLYIIVVDLGNEKRQIVSGLQSYYSLEELDNKKVIVVCNLKPAKLGGYESNGMILACGEEVVGLLSSDLDVGTYLKAGDILADNEKVINSKAFKKVEMFGESGKVIYSGKEVSGVSVDKTIDGKVC
jgi:methionyl-tRNA synthetase